MGGDVLVQLAQSARPLQIGLKGCPALAVRDGVEAIVFPRPAFAHSGQGDLPAQGRAHLVLFGIQSCPGGRTFLSGRHGLNLVAQGSDGIPML
jgi:hypothetical protein